MTNKLVVLLIISTLLIACKESNPTTSITTENQQNSISPDSLLILNIQNSTCPFPASEIVRPSAFSISLEGKIDAKHEVEMYLFYDTSKVQKGFVEVLGNYKYKNHDVAIILKGSLNISNGELALSAEKNNVIDEVFKGKTDALLNTFSGSWKKVSKNGKELPFELNKTQQEGNYTPLYQQYIFALKLTELLRLGEEEVATTDTVGVDKHGIYIKGLVCEESTFYPNSFGARKTYESTNSGSESSIDVNIWTVENSPIFFIYAQKSSSGYERKEVEEGEEEESYGYSSSEDELWLYKNNTFENILVNGSESSDEEPENADYSAETASMDWYAIIIDGELTVFEKATNKSWIWNASKGQLVLK